MNISTFVISSFEEFEDSKKRCESIGLKSPIRIDPVYTDDNCINKTRGETGCFRAHKNVWKACAEQDNDKCLILERDWTIGNQSTEHVKSELENIPPDKDFFMIGHCYGTLCLHAYVINKNYAEELLSVDECAYGRPVDHFLSEKYSHKKSGRYEKSTMPNCFGEGLIQQNRNLSNSLHDSNNSINEEFI